jgi:4'-phosphopantetheinyl transferase
MPLYKSFNPREETQVYIWEITESYNDLFRAVSLKDKSLTRLEHMKSTLHQCGFLSVRCLLQVAGYTDFDLIYSEDGKPHLTDGNFISISHSFGFSAIIISNLPVGIDLELQRDLIKKLGPKFCVSEYEFLNLNSEDYVRQLTVIWGVKEAVFKIVNLEGISFKNHIFVNNFQIDASETTARLDFGMIQKTFDVYFMEVEQYTLVYLFESQTTLQQ